MKSIKKTQLAIVGMIGAATMVLAGIPSSTAGDAGSCGMKTAGCPLSKETVAAKKDAASGCSMAQTVANKTESAAACPMSAKVAEKSGCAKGSCDMAGATFAVYIKEDGTVYLNDWKTSREELNKKLAAADEKAEGEEATAKTVALQVAEGVDPAVVEEIQKMITAAGATILQPDSESADDKVAAVNVER